MFDAKRPSEDPVLYLARATAAQVRDYFRGFFRVPTHAPPTEVAAPQAWRVDDRLVAQGPDGTTAALQHYVQHRGSATPAAIQAAHLAARHGARVVVAFDPTREDQLLVLLTERLGDEALREQLRAAGYLRIVDQVAFEEWLWFAS